MLRVCGLHRLSRIVVVAIGGLCPKDFAPVFPFRLYRDRVQS